MPQTHWSCQHKGFPYRTSFINFPSIVFLSRKGSLGGPTTSIHARLVRSSDVRLPACRCPCQHGHPPRPLKHVPNTPWDWNICLHHGSRTPFSVCNMCQSHGVSGCWKLVSTRETRCEGLWWLLPRPPSPARRALIQHLTTLHAPPHCGYGDDCLDKCGYEAAQQPGFVRSGWGFPTISHIVPMEPLNVHSRSSWVKIGEVHKRSKCSPYKTSKKNNGVLPEKGATALGSIRDLALLRRQDMDVQEFQVLAKLHCQCDAFHLWTSLGLKKLQRVNSLCQVGSIVGQVGGVVRWEMKASGGNIFRS